jgi:hypothetical protein
LKQAGVKTIADEEAGFANYVALRSRWEPIIHTLAPAMALPIEDIDPATMKPHLANERSDFNERLYTIDNPS